MALTYLIVDVGERSSGRGNGCEEWLLCRESPLNTCAQQWLTYLFARASIMCVAAAVLQCLVVVRLSGFACKFAFWSQINPVYGHVAYLFVRLSFLSRPIVSLCLCVSCVASHLLTRVLFCTCSLIVHKIFFLDLWSKRTALNAGKRGYFDVLQYS